MIFPGTYEEQMRENAKNENVKAALKDTIEVLNDMGYKAGADIFKQMMFRNEEGSKYENH